MTIEFTKQQQQLSLTIRGSIESFDDESLKLRLLETLQKHKLQTVNINAEGLEKWDSTLVVVLYELEKECRRKKISVTAAPPLRRSRAPSPLRSAPRSRS